MYWIIVYLLIAGLLNPSVFFHKDMQKASFFQCLKFGLLLNLVGFIVVPFMTIKQYRKTKQNTDLVVSNKDDDFMQIKNEKESFILMGNETVH